MEDERERKLREKLEMAQRQMVDSRTMNDSEQVADLEGAEMAEDPLFKNSKKIVDRESSYNQGRLRRGRLLSPERVDAFH